MAKKLTAKQAAERIAKIVERYWDGLDMPEEERERRIAAAFPKGPPKITKKGRRG